MAKERLVGDDGKFVQVTYGTEIVAAETAVVGTLYLVTAVDGSTGFPAAAEAGYLILGAGETLVGTDTALPLIETDLCDIQAWSLAFAKGEIDVTTLCDSQKRYRVGKNDITGSSTGVYKIGTTDLSGGIQNKFVDIVNLDDAAYAISKLNDDTIFAKLVTQKDDDAGETSQFYYAPVTFTTFSQGVSTGDEAQTFEAAFRIAPDDTNGTKVAYYSFLNS